mgnify:CR=1 FL=1
MRFVDQPTGQPALVPGLNQRYLVDEEALVRELTEIADPGDVLRERILTTAAELVRAVRRQAERSPQRPSLRPALRASVSPPRAAAPLVDSGQM